ncbi:hypothetical protein CWR48_18405 [Oceanobacillus arenosus]|uniref:Uncharacterized protein n=1 Tax=Oceanobacillus arenosus TaxID=1229153 RepID=A0A3D8PID7_9BACI|nr:hypothetical protein [Oceanobacillus arenosus]RDW15863.1 hypothetical protein CWR48_18405 [Oceanobacillus arenosus]
MADKMMRVAGRSKDGVPKAIATDGEGNQIVNILNAELKELRRSLDKLALGINDVYKSGTEFFPLKTVNRTGSNSYVKADQFFLLNLIGNPSNAAGIHVETTKTFTPTIDNAATVEIEYAIENKSAYNAIVNTLIYAEENVEWSVGKQDVHLAGTVKESVIVRLNVNTATLREKKLFIRFGISDTSTSVSVDFNVKLKRISLLGKANFGQSLVARDTATKEIVELSSIKDANGDNVIRFVNAAPFAYDQYTGTFMQTSKKSVQMYNETPSSIVPAGTNERKRITPASNCIANLNQFGLYIPGIPNSTGRHRIIVTIRIPQGGANASRVYVSDVESTKAITIDFMTNQDIRDIFRGLVFSNTQDLVIEYLNNADTQQAGARTYYATYLQEMVSL